MQGNALFHVWKHWGLDVWVKKKKAFSHMKFVFLELTNIQNFS